MAMSKRCLRISKSGLRAISKNCRKVSFLRLDQIEPQDDYERLYNENKVIELIPLSVDCIYQQNPSEEMFADAQLKAQGDAIITGMSYQLEQIGIIGSETDDYLHIPTTVMACHVEVDSLRYKVMQCTMTSFLEGYPLMYAMSLELDVTDNEVKESMSLYGSEI